jgi:hypothetical protein
MSIPGNLELNGRIFVLVKHTAGTESGDSCQGCAFYWNPHACSTFDCGGKHIFVVTKKSERRPSQSFLTKI